MTALATGPARSRLVHVADVGVLTLEPLDVDAHLDLVHRWVTHPRSRFWGMQGEDVAAVARTYRDLAARADHDVWLGRLDGAACFLAETYDPAGSELAGLPQVRAGDVGMHVLVAPPAGPSVRGLTTAVLDAVLTLCFADPACARVVVEPDVRNAAIARRNAEAGFVVAGLVRLTGKEAALSFCTRAAWRTARAARRDPHLPAHLTPGPMAHAQRLLCAKAIAELSHERVLAPVLVGDRYVVDLDGGVRYTFTARRFPLEHWRVEPASLDRVVGGVPAPLDAQRLVLEVRDRLAIPDDVLTTYLEEVAATLAALAWRTAHPQGRRVAELMDADLPAVEAAMTEGHPVFVAGAGRIGFGAADHEAYAPEAAPDVTLHWLAAHRDHTHLALAADLTEAGLDDARLDSGVRAAFAARLRALGLDPAHYLFLPVHPWQWEHKVAVTFAPDVAARRLVPLGPAGGALRPQQSIRTFLDARRPDRPYVKVALAIQNMGFLRGLSPAYMRDTPAINDHVADVVRGDPELAAGGFDVLREVAAVGYTGDAYHATPSAPGRPAAQRRMLAALWRESAQARLRPGERAVTMAALLHRDPDGAHLVTAWVARSGLEPAAWVRAYLRVYLRPLAHLLLVHELAFMPHGENVILVLDRDVPVRALLKDLGEEVAALHTRPLPAGVERIRARVPAAEAALPVLTDVVDGFLRHLCGILADDGVLDPEEFWALAGACLAEHAADHPEAHARVDLFCHAFPLVCLNRLQVRSPQHMVDLADPSSSLVTAGTLANPLAPWRPGTRDGGRRR